MAEAASPLVSIGVPVRNGEAMLADVLEAHCRQTHANIEIIVADNASTDRTPEIIADFMARDPRVRVVRHAEPLTMWRNHESTYREARGQYFQISSDNDIPADDYVEVLVAAMEADPRIGNAYADFLIFHTPAALGGAGPFAMDYDTRGMPIWRRLLSDPGSGYSTHGMWRVAHLGGFEWWDHAVSPDLPLMTYISVRSEIARVHGTALHKPAQPFKSGEERAQAQAFRSIESYSTIRLAWRCGKASAAAARDRGSRRSSWLDAGLVLSGMLWLHRRRILRWAFQQHVLRRPA